MLITTIALADRLSASSCGPIFAYDDRVSANQASRSNRLGVALSESTGIEMLILKNVFASRTFSRCFNSSSRADF